MRAGAALSRRLGWRGAAAVASVIVLVGVLAVLVEPTLLRPLIQHVVHSRSGRTIEFSALRLGFDAGFEPRLEFEDLVIENAPWAVSPEPFVRARRVRLDLTWSGLHTGVWIVKRMVLEDASVDLERAADGRRNGRLSTRDGRGPGRVAVLGIDGRRSRLQFLDRVTGFELRIASTPLPAPRVVAGLAALPLTRTLAFEGRQRGTPFSGQADVSDVLTLQRTGERFAVEGEFRTAAARLTVAGAAADLVVGLQVDADLHLDADPLAGLHPGLLPRLPPLRGVAADAHLVRDAQRWAVTHLQLKTRGSRFAGDLEFRPAGLPAGRPKLSATLRAARLDLDEWAAARGPEAARVVAAKAAGTASARKSGARDATPLDGPAAAAFDWRGLGGVDAAVDLSVAELVAGKAIVARDTLVKATLQDARLHLALPDTRIAGGHGSGELRLDATSAPAVVASLDARIAGVRLEELPSAWSAAVRSQLSGGSVSATASVSVRGRTLAEWIGSASGSLRGSLDGTSVSDRLEAKLGLDGFGFLRSVLSGADAVPVRCAELALDLQAGRGTVRRLTFDTARTAVAGTGSVDFVGRTLDLVLAPSSHVGAIFALDRDIRIRGPLAKPRASLQAAGARAAAPACSRG